MGKGSARAISLAECKCHNATKDNVHKLLACTTSIFERRQTTNPNTNPKESILSAYPLPRAARPEAAQAAP